MCSCPQNTSITEQQKNEKDKKGKPSSPKLWKCKLSADLGGIMSLNSVWMSVWSIEGQLLPKGKRSCGNRAKALGGCDMYRGDWGVVVCHCSPSPSVVQHSIGEWRSETGRFDWESSVSHSVQPAIVLKCSATSRWVLSFLWWHLINLKHKLSSTGRWDCCFIPLLR